MSVLWARLELKERGWRRACDMRFGAPRSCLNCAKRREDPILGRVQWPREVRARGKQRRQERVHRKVDPGPRRTGGGPQAPQHVHRLHVRARPAPSGLGGRRQLSRRGAGRPCRPHRCDAPGRRRGAGRGQRPWHAGRHAPDAKQADGRGDPHHAARRREVRRQGLCGLRRTARRGRVGGQRAEPPARGRDRPGRLPLVAALPKSAPGGAADQGREVQAHRHDGDILGRPGDLRDHHLLVRDDQPPFAGDGFPEQGPDDRAA